VFLFKRVKFDTVITSEELYNYSYEELWNEVNVSDAQHNIKGKDETQLTNLNWQFHIRPINPNGKEYLFMAITHISASGDINPWTIIPLNGIPGSCCEGGTTPSVPGDNTDTSSNCSIQIILNDYVKITEPGPEPDTGIFVPDFTIKLNAFNNSNEPVTFNFRTCNIEIHYKTDAAENSYRTPYIIEIGGSVNVDSNKSISQSIHYSSNENLSESLGQNL